MPRSPGFGCDKWINEMAIEPWHNEYNYYTDQMGRSNYEDEMRSRQNAYNGQMSQALGRLQDQGQPKPVAIPQQPASNPTLLLLGEDE